MYTINRPVEFPGTRDEADENYASHSFIWDNDGDTRCGACDSRPSYVAAHYPCGADVPRETVLTLIPGEVVEVRGGEVEFRYDGKPSGVLIAPANGDPAYIRGTEHLTFVLGDGVEAVVVDRELVSV